MSADVSKKLKDASVRARLLCLEESTWSEAAPGCNEDQGEDPDKLQDSAAEVVALEHAGNHRSPTGRTQIMNAPLFWSIA